jgi:hypothetical protein
MASLFRFECHRSAAEGWVASGTVRGVAGGSFEERSVWFGCQGETWAELRAGMAALVKVLKPRVAVQAHTTPIEAFVRPWPADRPFLIPPIGRSEQVFENLLNVGSRRRDFVEIVDDVRIVSFLKLGALAVLKPGTAWKPELVSSFLEFAIGLVPEHPTPAPERAGQTPADLVDELLLAVKY